MRSQFTFYASFYEAIARIRKKADRADAYDAIVRYALTGEEPDLDSLSDAVAVSFINAKPNLDASRKKAKSGASGGSKRKQTGSKPEANEDQTEATRKRGEPASEKENEKEDEKEKENECYPPMPPKGSLEGDGLDRMFEGLWMSYPPQRLGHRAEAAEAYAASIRTAQDAKLAMDSLGKWKRSEQWDREGGRYIPRLSNWLRRGDWRNPPAKPAVPKGASGELGQAELEAIEQMFSRPTEPLPEDAYGDTL